MLSWRLRLYSQYVGWCVLCEGKGDVPAMGVPIAQLRTARNATVAPARRICQTSGSDDATVRQALHIHYLLHTFPVCRRMVPPKPGPGSDRHAGFTPHALWMLCTYSVDTLFRHRESTESVCRQEGEESEVGRGEGEETKRPAPNGAGLNPNGLWLGIIFLSQDGRCRWR